MPEITQKDRFLRLETPIGKDVLLIEHCTGSEALSGLFSLELDLLLDLDKHRTSDVKPEDLLARKVTLALELKTGERFFNGIVKRLTQGVRDNRFQHYRMEIVPWLWLLTLKSDCRIFQNMTAPEIIKKVFDEHGDPVAYRDALKQTYAKREYCVQYRETSFDFVSRLMEFEGIFYYFEHTDKGHTLVLADSNTVFKQVPDNNGRFRFTPEGGYEERLDTVSSVSRQHELRSGKWELRDYNFETPTQNLETKEPTTIQVDNNPNHNRYDYPGGYEKVQDGQKVVRARMEEDEAQYLVLTGTSLARAFASGQQFELTEHRDMAGKYALVSVHHNISQSPSYVSGTSVDNHYQNSFVCIPSTVPFHPHRVTPKPIVQGPQTAVVTVKSGEEMWLDKYGRVRVQFHWDREGKNDEKTTCWVRVAQIWAGTNWGAHFWPRVGQEVVVDFLEGDPDRPLVTGSVYNATNMPPYDLPGNHTRSGIKSRSTKGGGASDYNEIRLEDKKGDEQVFLHAQKDMDVRVENDSREYVGHDLHLIVKKNQQEEVDGDKSLEVKGDHSEKIGGKMSLDVSSDRHEKVGTNYAVESGQEIHIKGGMKVIIEAGMQLTIKAAGSFVDVGPAGVTIQGTMVNINSGGSAGSGSGVNLKSPLKADVADDGTKGKKLN